MKWFSKTVLHADLKKTLHESKLLQLGGRQFLLAILLGSITVFVIYSYLHQIEKKSEYQNSMLTVVVAKSIIPAQTLIRPEMLTTRMIPRQFVSPGSLQSINLVSGRIAAVNVASGEVISNSLLVNMQKNTNLTYMIPKNYRATSVLVQGPNGVAGMVKPGDYVDVIVTLTEKVNRSYTLFQNVLVLGIDKSFDPNLSGGKNEKANTAAVVTLALTPQQVEIVALASDKGQLSLALRSHEDNNQSYSPGAVLNSQSGYIYTPGSTPSKPGTTIIGGSKVLQ